MPSVMESTKKSGALAPKGLLTTRIRSPCAGVSQGRWDPPSSPPLLLLLLILPVSAKMRTPGCAAIGGVHAKMARREMSAANLLLDSRFQPNLAGLPVQVH